MFESLFSPAGLASLFTLTIMEIVLGIDNVIFISILSGRLPKEEQTRARLLGLGLALVMRIMLLLMITWIVGFKKPLINDFFGIDISVRDLILFSGGLFLIYKSTTEIHEKLEGDDVTENGKKKLSLISAIIQIVLLDIVFSFDSILTAIGLVNDPEKDVMIMIIAVVISLLIMLGFSKPISNFINKHPTTKMLALAFLLMIGLMLVMESFHKEVEKGYVYSAIAFSLFVELLNMRAHKNSHPVKLKGKIYEEETNTDDKK